MRKWWILISFIVLVSIGLRFWGLHKVPAALYVDEIDLGYQARSMLETGRDYRGGDGLIVTRSFNADRLPVSVWGTMVSTAIFKNPFYQVRGGAAMAGVVVVVLAGCLTWWWSKKKELSVICMIIFGVSPWMIQFSRIGFEGMWVVLLVLLALTSWAAHLQRKKWGYPLFVISLGLSLYAYRSMSLLVWVFLSGVVLIYPREVWELGVKKIVLGALVFLALAIPHYWKTVLAPSDELRINQISIFSDPMVPIKVIRNRELASGDYESDELGRSPKWWSKIMFNKPVSYLDALTNNYLKAWSGEFLFVSGDPNPRHAPGGMGMLYVIDVVGLLAGLWYLYKNQNLKWVRLLGWLLLLTPIGSVITENGGTHGHRLIVFGAMLLLTVSLGWWQIASSKSFWKWILGAVYLVLIGFYLVKYQVNYPFESFRSFGYGYMEAVQEVAKIEGNFARVEMTQSIDPPIFYYLFWNNVPPQEVINYGTNFSKDTNKGMLLDRYKALEWEEGVKFDVDLLKVDSLYILTQKELPFDLRDESKIPTGIRLWKVISYPDRTPAFYIVSRE